MDSLLNICPSLKATCAFVLQNKLSEEKVEDAVVATTIIKEHVHLMLFVNAYVVLLR